MFVSSQRNSADAGPAPVRITYHAIMRWQQRVNPAASLSAAASEIERLVATGRSRPTPRSWMRGRAGPPGTRFVYSAEFPGVAAIVKGRAVLTILTKELCGAPRRPSQRDTRRAG